MFLNPYGLRSQTCIQESELRSKVQAEEARIAAQHQAIQGAHAQVKAKQAEQDKVAAALHEREALLMEREAAVEKHRAAVENQQASVSRLLQQARVESARPRNVAPEMPVQPLVAPLRPTASARAALPRSNGSHRAHFKNKAGTSTRMFLTAMSVSPSGLPISPRIILRLYIGTRLFRQRRRCSTRSSENWDISPLN